MASKTLLGFSLSYLPHYFTLKRADFHPEMFDLLNDWKVQFLSITGFRGCAKSTAAATALPLFAALEGKSKFIVVINETDDVSKLTIANIREELEFNELIRADYGHLLIKEKGVTKFSDQTILLANGVRIFARSRGQKIRGLRHREHRIELVIVDDPEERDKVQKKQYRDKTENWLTGDVIPACEEQASRLIVIGNELHTDALMARLRQNELFEHRDYPLIKKGFDGEGQALAWENCTWQGKYPTPEALARQELKVGRTAWLREYLLRVIPPDGQEVKEEWIRKYKTGTLPQGIKIAAAVDLAISQSETADYTAMVSGILAIVNDQPKIYILPNPINDHLSFHETIQTMTSLATALRGYGIPTIYVEDVQYQKAAIQEGHRHLLPIVPVRPGSDKRARLRTAAIYLQNGTVEFPDKGCEDLITQLLGFGIEDHDDLVDALVYLILGLAGEGMELPETIML